MSGSESGIRFIDSTFNAIDDCDRVIDGIFSWRRRLPKPRLDAIALIQRVDVYRPIAASAACRTHGGRVGVLLEERAQVSRLLRSWLQLMCRA
ncbi:hypothetical protein CS343_14665 [Bordetella bronchiseptica]|nr:hypothetical protein CS343_14665 [Bordetella bronchiseptica]